MGSPGASRGDPESSWDAFGAPRGDPDERDARSGRSWGGSRRAEKSPKSDFREVQGGQSAPFPSFEHVHFVNLMKPWGAPGDPWTILAGFGSSREGPEGALGGPGWGPGSSQVAPGDPPSKKTRVLEPLKGAQGRPSFKNNAKTLVLLCLTNYHSFFLFFIGSAPGGVPKVQGGSRDRRGTPLQLPRGPSEKVIRSIGGLLEGSGIRKSTPGLQI